MPKPLRMADVQEIGEILEFKWPICQLGIGRTMQNAGSGTENGTRSVACAIDLPGAFLQFAPVKNIPLLLLLLTIALAGCNEPKQGAAAQTNTAVISPAFAPPYLTNAQPCLPTIKLFIGGEELNTELAVRPVEI